MLRDGDTALAAAYASGSLIAGGFAIATAAADNFQPAR